MSFWNDLTGTVSSQDQQQLASQVQPINAANFQIGGLQGYLGNLSGLSTQSAMLGQQAGQDSQQEQGVFNQLGGLANGSTPGEGQALLQQGLNQAQAQQTSQALSQQGSANPALASRQIASSGAQLQGQAGSNAAMVGAQQQMQALGEQAQLAQNIRAQNYQQQFSALQQQQNLQDNMLQANEQQTSFNVQNQQMTTAYQQWQYQQAYANAQQQAQGIGALFKSGLNAVASGVGGFTGGAL